MKKRRLKRIITVLIATVMFMMSSSMGKIIGFDYSIKSFAENNDSIVFSFNKNSGTIFLEGKGDMPLYKSTPWFSFIDKIKTVVIADGITSISAGAFKEGVNITSVIIPESVINIGEAAFEACYSVSNLDIPDSVKKISNRAFADVVNINYNGTANGAPWGALTLNCYVEDDIVYSDSQKNKLVSCNRNISGTIILPNSVQSIEENAFWNCKKIKEIILPDGLTYIGKCAFTSCESLEYIDLSNVNIIEEYAFWECKKLKEVFLSENISEINEGVFQGCTELSALEIPDSVISIGSSAFGSCTSLLPYIPNTVTSIDKGAFRNVRNIEYHGSATGSPWSAWCVNGYVEKSLVYKDNKKSYLVGCLSNAEDEIIIPDSVTEINLNAFNGCNSISSVVIGKGIKSIEKQQFYYLEELETVTLPDCIQYIDEWAFQCCSKLQSFTIPDSVVSIGTGAFSGCTNLKEINIPENITEIGEWAFCDCISLNEIIIPNSITVIEKETFRGCRGAKKIVIPDSVTVIKSNAFADCTGTSILIPNSVNEIESGAFYNARNIEYYGSNLEIESVWPVWAYNGYVEDELVYSDSSKTELLACFTSADGYISIPNTITKINERAFYECAEITDIKIPNSVETIGWGAFAFCTKLKSIIVPNSVTSMGDCVFSDCTELVSVTLSDNITDMGIGIFENCTNLSSISMPNSITYIPADTFWGCTNLYEVILSKNITGINSGAFANCNNLSIVTVSSADFSVGYGVDAFENSSDNLMFVVNEKNTDAIDYAESKRIPVVTFSYSESEKQLSFNGNTVIYEGLEYNCLPKLIKEYPDAETIYFKRLEFDGVQPDSFEIDLENVDKESENLAFNNLYVKLSVIKEGGEENISFGKLFELLESCNYDAFKMRLNSDEEATEQTFFEKVIQVIETFFEDAIRVITKVINFVASIFKKK